jgi:serine/threonine-protein kinase RIO1
MEFEQAEHIHPDLVALFEQTVLGTNGAKYKHLDVAQSVAHTDHPLSFSLLRRENLLANITCIYGTLLLTNAFSPKERRV